MVRGTIRQRMLAPHLTKPVDMPEAMKKYVDEHHKRKKDERNRRRHVQGEGGQTR